MFRTQELRELNKVKIIYTSSSPGPENQESSTKTVFEAWTPKGWSTSMGSSLANLFGAGSQSAGEDGLTWTNIAALMLQQLGPSMGLPGSWALDFASKQVFRGAVPMQFSIPCFLFLQENYYNDILAPLLRLADFILPKRNSSVTSDDAYNAGSEWLEKMRNKEIAKQKKKGNPNSTGGIYELGQKALDWIKEYMGTIAVLDGPKMLGTSKEQVRVYVSIGPFIIEDVLIENINITTPPMTLVDSLGKAIPDRVDLTLNIKTQRGATFDLVKNFLNPETDSI